MHGFGDAAPADTLPETLFEKLRSGGGWAVDDAIPGFELVGFAPVSSPVLMPDFGVVVAAPRDGVALPIYDRARLILVVAIGMVAAVVLVAASILRRIENRLSRASN